ncbi:MAG: QsdR family transcriptional regulator [Actinomycetota bacterium]|nr:QsdR family transcriptional regulator [Actinomycetota bacterium]
MDEGPHVTPRPGRPAAASREEAFEYAVGMYLRGRRIDLSVLASELKVGRTTVHRWFGTREDLVVDILGWTAVALLADVESRVGGEGPRGLLDTFDRFNQELLEVPALSTFLASERNSMDFLVRADRGPQPMLVDAIGGMIQREIDAGRYQAPVDSETMAYAIVRLAQSFLYADSATGIPVDHVRLRRIEAVLLGLTPDATE